MKGDILLSWKTELDCAEQNVNMRDCDIIMDINEPPTDEPLQQYESWLENNDTIITYYPQYNLHQVIHTKWYV